MREKTEKKETQKDEELVELFKAGDKRAFDQLLTRYGDFVRGLARRYFLPGGETEDLFQEGLMGLWQAIATYEVGKSSFKTFAYLCVSNRIKDAVKKATAKKKDPLNSAVSISDIEYPVESPEGEVLWQIERSDFLRAINKVLSDYEFRVLTLYLDGLAISEICESTGKSGKSIDNTLQRIKKKYYLFSQDYTSDKE